jgi:hypothetical protein
VELAMAEDRSPKSISQADVRQGPCPFCGGGSFVWGFFSPGSAPFTFKTAEDSWWVRNTSLGGAEVEARACKSCGNVQLFLKQPPSPA